MNLRNWHSNRIAYLQYVAPPERAVPSDSPNPLRLMLMDLYKINERQI